MDMRNKWKQDKGTWWFLKIYMLNMKLERLCTDIDFSFTTRNHFYGSLLSKKFQSYHGAAAKNPYLFMRFETHQYDRLIFTTMTHSHLKHAKPAKFWSREEKGQTRQLGDWKQRYNEYNGVHWWVLSQSRAKPAPTQNLSSLRFTHFSIDDAETMSRSSSRYSKK